MRAGASLPLQHVQTEIAGFVQQVLEILPFRHVEHPGGAVPEQGRQLLFGKGGQRFGLLLEPFRQTQGLAQQILALQAISTAGAVSTHRSLIWTGRGRGA